MKWKDIQKISRSGVEYNPLLRASDSNEESSILKTPLGAPQTVSQGLMGIPSPSTPPSPHTPTPPPLPPLFNMANAMKIPIFKGLGIEVPEQFWFVVDFV